MSSNNAVVVGAGPAGLGAAIALARRGTRVTLLEKETEIGINRRGETIRFHQGMENLLYKGFFDEQAIHRINQRTYYSHTGQKKADRKISTWNLIIEYPRFVQTLAKAAREAGVEIITNAPVTRYNKGGQKVDSVTAAVGGRQKDFSAELFFAAAGHTDPASDKAKRAKARLDIPIRKYLVRNYAGRDTHLEYFFHVDETWPAIAAIFPRGNREAEVLYMFLTDAAKKPAPEMDFKKIAAIIDGFEAEHPVFGEKLRGAERYYETNTLIPMGDIGQDILPAENLVVVGDSAGHVEGRGGSGIRSSFMMGHLSAEAALTTLMADGHSEAAQRAFKKTVLESEQMKELKELNLKFGLPRRAFFGTVTSPGAICSGLRSSFLCGSGSRIRVDVMHRCDTGVP
jgi:flavin-dependent dehydrogenase